MNEIMVSICCITYNHEKYIRDALDGFLKQKTDFKFEVLIHDDASTDGTADIIREYEEKYPDIIKPIYQTVNQYSKGLKIIFNILLPLVKGKYIAFCEGDDWWSDEYKLQKQIDFMESHSDYVCCYGANYEVEAETKAVSRINKKYDQNRTFTVEECIIPKGMPHTSTCVIRRDVYIRQPEFCLATPVGDVVTLSWAGVNGKVYYFHDIFSCYRVAVPGSWSVRSDNNEKMQNDHSKRMRQYFESLDKYTHFKHHSFISDKIDGYKMYEQRKKRQIWKVINNSSFRRGTSHQKFVWIVETMFPCLLRLYYKWRHLDKQVKKEARYGDK